MKFCVSCMKRQSIKIVNKRWLCQMCVDARLNAIKKVKSEKA